MERILKWLTLVLVLAEILLVRAGLLDLRAAIGVVAGIELLLFLLASRQIFVAVRRYRRHRASGLDVWAAAEEGLTILLPPRLARVVVMEPRLWFCLGKWVLRRHRLREGEFSYHKRSIVGVLMVVVLLTTPLELLVFELLIPWTWLRWVFLILGVYALFWAFGFYASIVVLPHRLEANHVRLHYGILASASIPFTVIDRIELERRQAPKNGDGLSVSKEEDAAYLAVVGRTDVTLWLKEAWPLQGALAPTPPVMAICVATDRPEQFVEQLRQCLAQDQPTLL